MSFSKLFVFKGTQVIAEEVLGKWFFVEEGTRLHGFYLGILYKGGTLKVSATRKQSMLLRIPVLMKHTSITRLPKYNIHDQSFVSLVIEKINSYFIHHKEQI